MATAPAGELHDLVQPGDIISLDPLEIAIGERLRPIDPAWATAIGQSMMREGQIHPVDVRRRAGGGWELAGAGGHRVTGARLAGIPIDAKVQVFGDELVRRREAAENLFRRANEPFERAEHMAELVRLHRERASADVRDHRSASVPTGLSREAKETCDMMSHVYGWTDEVASELGFSKRTIQRDLQLYRGLRPSVVQLLRENRHPVLKNASQLRALARVQGSEQERVATKLINVGYGAAKSVSEAIRLVRGNGAPAPEDKRLSAFLGSFQRMSLAERKGALLQLAGLLPAPFKLVEDR